MSRRTRKRKLESEDQLMVDWEQENFLPDDLRDEMESMWEIPQIFHFLYLVKAALNLPQLSMYEMERMLLIPKASKQLANIMTSLLSSSALIPKLRRIPPMPYEFWTNILTHKIRGWAKVFEGKHGDVVKVLETIGVEPEFWSVFPEATQNHVKDFEEFSFKQRVWLLKTVCDTAMHSRKVIQEEMTKQQWEHQFEIILGTDRHGARYIYFPQFLNTDLRIYKHSLDNEILLSVRPSMPKDSPKLKEMVKLESNCVNTKVIKPRRRKSRWKNGVDTKPRRPVNKSIIKSNLSDSSKASNVSTLNLSNTESRCSRSSSKTSEDSTISLGTIKRVSDLSDCEGSNFSDISSNDLNSEKMFKGFSRDNNGKYNISMISGLLDNLTSTFENKQDMEESFQLKLNTRNNETYTCKDNLVENTNNNYTEAKCTSELLILARNSKTDNEKLSDSVGNEPSAFTNELATFTKFKSNDHKLIEARRKDGAELRDEDNENSSYLISHTKSRHSGRSSKSFIGNGRNSPIQNNNRESISANSEKDLDSEHGLDDYQKGLVDKSVSDDDTICYSDYEEEDSDFKKYVTSERRKKEVESFNEILSALSKSKFQLVADSIESLKDLIANLSTTDNERGNALKPASSETKLVQKLTNLLGSLEKLEPLLKESAKKARSKLQKEWSNFKNGIMEDQDSSSEDGLSSNWWILGSQGCPLQSSDASLPTLPKPTLSPFGPQNSTTKEVEYEADSKDTSESTATMSVNGSPSKKIDEKTERNTGKVERSTEHEESEEVEDEHSKEEPEVRRVLRARGVSSYTEQCSSDEENDESELERWTDFEAMYAGPSTQEGPTSSRYTKEGHTSNRSEEEDSDQEWILPGTRKRKYKRPSANRRLKSFNYKIQNIKMDLQENKRASTSWRKSGDIKNVDKSSNPNAVNTTGISVEKGTSGSFKMESVHSELDIKDEGFIYEPPVEYPNTSVDVMMQSSPLISSPVVAEIPQMTPQLPVSYYLQNTAGCIVQSSPSNFLPQPNSYQMSEVIHQQPYISNPGYVPCMINAQPSYVVPAGPIHRMPAMDTIVQSPIVQQNCPQQNLPQGSNVRPRRKPLNRSGLNQSFPHPNGAVIRSSMPIREVSSKQIQPRGGTSNAPLRMPTISQQPPTTKSNKPKTTSLIVLSDSDDEIEMIITEKTTDTVSTPVQSATLPKPTITSEVTVPAPMSHIPLQILQRMNQGGISITPVKPPPPQQSSSSHTQLVVVVNETGSHYALALPNGSKLILTPEQVAQIRASNGGKLVL
ncbi:uncharacterized protein [Prorops nasuta]|uniref:uncharacterized protein isoform X2 n=1 Tax=Prorops nasuta TaxID=863751 RepID=UPI0034CFDCFF